ncbi:hypothetical protein RN001_003631 [Aquatica leii]|uniref:Uncharacterized protein n=1 Tax=Aquatica leii TaxID=1421715 RepID=A0AAN7QBU6_9COLE|nr:hypothetical protein RN001_003631 [Aquatica leii]
MQENQSSKWSEGLRFVQLKKNRSFHRGIQRTPYQAMFGTSLINGLTDSNLPLEIIERLRDEEDINRFQNPVNKNVQNTLSDQFDAELGNIDNVENSNISTNEAAVQPMNEPENCGDENDGNEARIKLINQHRFECVNSLKKQATEMLQQSCSKFPKIETVQHVLVKIPDVDRGRLAPRNVLAVVLSEKEDLYQLGTTSGVLEKLYARNESASNIHNLMIT